MTKCLKPGAPVSAPKSKRNIERGAPAIDLETAGYDGTAVLLRVSEDSAEAYQEEQRMLCAVNDAAWEVIRKIHEEGAPIHPGLAQDQVYTVVRIAVEAAAAKVAGYESWTAFEIARAVRLVGKLK
jgi:hypothetical protein